MACTWFGAAALLLLFSTTLLNMIALILPMWSTSNAANASLVQKLTKADFAAGIWGFCTDVELDVASSSSNDSAAFNHCFFFHTPTKYNLTAIVPDYSSSFAAASVCDDYQESRAAGENASQTYTSELAFAVGMNSTSFAKFLDKSCGSLGNATLSFGALSMAAGAIAFTILLLGITCRKTTSFIILVGRFMVVVAFISTVLAIILWLVQSKMLDDEDDIHLSGSFELAVSAAVLYLVSMALVAVHKDEVDELDLVWIGPLYLVMEQ